MPNMLKVTLSTFLFLILTLTLSGCAALVQQSQQTDTPATDSDNGAHTETEDIHEDHAGKHIQTKFLVVDSPHIGQTVSSPLTITGQISGSWSFEGQFTVMIIDSDSVIIADEPATLQGDWMTVDLVPFEVTLEFDPGDSEEGKIIFTKANPSGLPENDESINMNIKF